MTAGLPAFLVEAIFYIGAVFKETRDWLEWLGAEWKQAAFLWVTALVPFLIFSLAAGTFRPNAFYVLIFLTAVFSFWYVLVPRRAAYDAGFLVLAAVPVILRVFQRIYVSPDAHLRVDVLGHLMWIRVGVTALFVFRRWDPGAFGFWPRWSEWRTGILYYGLVLVPIVLLAVGIHDVRFEPLQGSWWRIAVIALGTFFGILWVVALGEELFFRGMIQRALSDSWHSPQWAIAASAALFGSAHLWFHHFPDWRRALVAGLLGVGCGIGYFRTGSVRAPMVTHAFVVATWRVFFR